MSAEFSDLDLDALRLRGDSVVDPLVDQCARLLGQPDDLAAALVRYLATDSESGLARWRNERRELPDWIDRSVLEHGQDVFRRWSLPMATCLFTASLPWTYAAAKGVRVLDRVSLLRGSDVRRRIAETGLMLVSLHDVNLLEDVPAFSPGSDAYRTATDVRVFHAAFRRVAASSEGWDTADSGVPINQEDLLGTLLSFTTVVFEALPRLGVVLNDAERHAYLHLWLAMGVYLGIEESILPRTVEEASVRQLQIAAHQHRPSIEGVNLMRVLIHEMQLSMPRGFVKLPQTVVRRAVGDDISDQLGVPRAAWWAPLLGLTSAWGRAMSRSGTFRRLAAWPTRLVGASVFRLYIDEALGNDHARYRVERIDRTGWRLGRGPLRRRLRRIRTVWREASIARHEVGQ